VKPKLKLFVIVAVGVCVVTAVCLYVGENRLKREQERVYQEVADCEQAVPEYGDYIAHAQNISYVAPNAEDIGADQRQCRPGLTESEVRKILGAPTYVSAGSSKEGAEYWGCTWAYVLRSQPGKDEPIIIDKIDVEFSPERKTSSCSRTNEYGEQILAAQRVQH
jgi:hypothetical protein